MRYDPAAEGADCDACPLKGRPVVAPELRPAPRFLVIGIEPTVEEEKDGRPLRGSSGAELDRALQLNGVRREQVSITLARLCRCPRNSPKEWQKQSLSACAPRLHREIARSPAVLMLGAQALESAYGQAKVHEAGRALEAGDEALRADVAADLLQDADDEKPKNLRVSMGEAGLSRLRGFPLDVGGKPAIATWHPVLVTNTRRWTSVFRADVGKLLRHAEGRLDWVDPEVVLDPTPEQLDAVLDRFIAAGKPVCTDVETEPAPGREFDQDHDLLRCVGLGNADLAVVAGFKSVERPAKKFRCPPQVARERIRNFYQRGGVVHCGHNVNVYDRPVMHRHGMPLPDYQDVFDSIIASHVTQSELPHGLDSLLSRRTDAPKHKPPTKHDQWKSDDELHFYCALDCAGDARLVPGYVSDLKRTNQIQVYKSDVRLQKLCAGMHSTGLFIVKGEQERHRQRLTLAMEDAKKRFFDAAGTEINIGSHQQVRRLLFDDLGLAWPSLETDSGQPSTSRNAIYEIVQRALPEQTVRLLDALIDYRRAQKYLGTFVNGFMPGPDGRIHPFWKPHVAVTGRLAAADPGIQQLPDRKDDVDSLRSQIGAEEGNVLVAADMEQLELRLVTIMSQDPIWFDAFTTCDKCGHKWKAHQAGGKAPCKGFKPRDVHKINAASFFGVRYEDVQPFQRTFAKTLTYMFLYKGGAATAAENMRKVRDPKTGKRPYARFTEAQGEVMRERLLRDHPALPRWWDRVLEEFRKHKLLRTRILGRQREFLDSQYANEGEEDQNEIINFGVQGMGGDHMGGAGAAGKFMDAAPWGLYGPGINLHGHDSLMGEFRESEAERIGRVLEECMYGEYDDLPFPAKAKIGKTWAEME